MFDEALGLSPGETAVLAVLMLRGAADARRAEEPHRPACTASASLAEVQATLDALIARELVAAQPRRPGPEGAALHAAAGR